jgi:alkaline phosphatase D
MALTRRRLLGAAAATAGTAGLALHAAGFTAARAWAAPRFAANPFSLGVASGDPAPDGVVLWTRLAPDPLALDGRGGMPDESVAVGWEVAEDEAFGKVVVSGETTAVAELAHSVHVEVGGLEAGRDYFYRFRAGSDVSPAGRTRTAPAPGSTAALSFAFASCQCWYEGFYTAYRHIAESEDLDFVVHLGDYLYEYGVGATGGVRGVSLDPSFQKETYSLAEYRNRYALTLLDPDLRAAHAALPWVLTWDDHEVENNWAGDIAQIDNDGYPDGDLAAWRDRRARAFQSYYEHLPLRLPQKPSGADAVLYRRLTFGALMDLHVLDTRSHRDDQACGDGLQTACEARTDPARTMLGDRQEEWLLGNATRSAAVWNVLANQTMIAQVDQDPATAVAAFGMDMWDGYTAARDRLLTGLHEGKAPNPVVLTGDIHRSVVADLRLDFADPASPVVATEFAGTSISSGGDGAAMDEVGEAWLTPGVNPHLKWHNAQRGYTVVTCDAERLTAAYRVLPYVSTPGAPVETAATFAVEAGRPGAQPG